MRITENLKNKIKISLEKNREINNLLINENEDILEKIGFIEGDWTSYLKINEKM